MLHDSSVLDRSKIDLGVVYSKLDTQFLQFHFALLSTFRLR